MGKPEAAIVAWAEKQAAPAESPSYTRLTDADRVVILKLHDEGLTQTAIAQRLGRSVSTINDVIQTYAPTMDLAKRKLRAAAAKMADNVIENGKPSDHVEVLGRIDVIPRQEERNQGVTVIVGGGAEVKIGVLVSPLL